MKLIFTVTATKNLRGMPKRDAGALMEKLNTFAVDPLAPHSWAKAFGDGVVRVRQGGWRAVCDVDHGTVTVVVVKIGHRREVYR